METEKCICKPPSVTRSADDGVLLEDLKKKWKVENDQWQIRMMKMKDECVKFWFFKKKWRENHLIGRKTLTLETRLTVSYEKGRNVEKVGEINSFVMKISGQNHHPQSNRTFLFDCCRFRPSSTTSSSSESEKPPGGTDCVEFRLQEDF